MFFQASSNFFTRGGGSETLKKESKAEHEKSHLLESYGALFLALEKTEKRS